MGCSGYLYIHFLELDRLKQKAKAKALKWLLEDFFEGQLKWCKSWEDLGQISSLCGDDLEKLVVEAIDVVVAEYDRIMDKQKQKLQEILKRMPWQAEKQCKEIEELLKEVES